MDFIDYWNNIYWLLEAVIDIYCDLCDLYYLDLDIKATVRSPHPNLYNKL